MNKKAREQLNFIKKRLASQKKEKYKIKKGFFTLSEKKALRKKHKAVLKYSHRHYKPKTYEIARGRLKIKQLTTIVKNYSGRNNTGRITVRHKGGRVKRFYRILNYKHKLEGPAQVVKISYDPNRSGFIALLLFASGIMTYVLCAEKVRIGQYILISRGLPPRKRRFRKAQRQNTKIKTFISEIDEIKKMLNKDLKIKNKKRREVRHPRIVANLGIGHGNILPLRFIPLGSFVFNISQTLHSKPIFGRAAGVYLKLERLKLQLNKIGYAGLKLPSGKFVYVDIDCLATFGRVSNQDHHLRKLNKAGENRWRGIRPSVRGVAMNPVDHPMGGGEGKTSGGRPSVSAWGRLTKGFKTKKKREIKKDKILLRRRNKLFNYKILFKKKFKKTQFYQKKRKQSDKTVENNYKKADYKKLYYHENVVRKTIN